jgi:hypothetical protein
LGFWDEKQIFLKSVAAPSSQQVLDQSVNYDGPLPRRKGVQSHGSKGVTVKGR